MIKERTLRVLEFTRIRELLAEGALTETGAMFYTGHCTSLPAYARMKEIMSDRLAYIHCGAAIAL